MQQMTQEIKEKVDYKVDLKQRQRNMSMFVFSRHVQKNNQIFEESFKERERGKVEGNKKVYVKLREPILVGSKGEENSCRFKL